MTAQFWYDILQREKGKIHLNLLVSPGHYGRGLSVVYENIDLIQEQLKEAEISFDPDDSISRGYLLIEETDEPEIEFVDTNLDRRIMGTMMHGKTDEIDKEALEQRLKSANFKKGLPNKF